MEKKFVNLAKGEKITTTADFAKVFSKLNVDHKTKVIKNLRTTLETGFSPHNQFKLLDKERAATKQLLAWCSVNLLVGDELCPPENINQY